jgi:cysteine desulfurase/selenocysteine lyase
MAFDVARVRSQFPILRRKVPTLDGRQRPLIYMDHGASTHAPQPVIDRVVEVLSRSYANIHRGNHTLSLQSSDDFDHAVKAMCRFVGADKGQIGVLGQNTTMVLDMAAHIVATRKGKTLTTNMEHHSNDLPHRRRGAVVRAEVDGQGRVLLDDLQAKLDKGGIKLVTVSGASNVTGYTPPIHKIARMAHGAGALILVDAAQLYAHKPIDLKAEGHPEHIDMLAAAGHKSYAPLGSAILVASKELLDAAPPYMPGGGTVQWVTDEDTLFATGPDRHMGGTPNIVGAIAFAAATEYLDSLGMEEVRAHEEGLIREGIKRFAEMEDDGLVRLLGPRRASEKVGVLSFDVPGVRHERVAAILNHEHAIATRNGCFCAQPLLNRLLGLGTTPDWTKSVSKGKQVQVPGAVRATLGLYNTEAELEALCDAVEQIAKGRVRGEYETDGRLCRPAHAPQEILASS